MRSDVALDRLTLRSFTRGNCAELLVNGEATFDAIFKAIEMARSYVLAMVRRPLMTFDAKWQLICMLCKEVPTFENGLAKRVELGDGNMGVAVTFTLHEKATWGDGTPLTSKDIAFTVDVGKHEIGTGSRQAAFHGHGVADL